MQSSALPLGYVVDQMERKTRFELAPLALARRFRTFTTANLYTVIVLIGLYCSVIAVLLPLVPTSNLTQEVSPMVAVLSSSGLGWAAGSINVILVTAIISTMLAATFGLIEL